MTADAGTAPAFRIELLGPWRPFDPADPLPGPQYDAVRADLAAAHLVAPPTPEGTRLVLAATLVEAPLEDLDTAPPLFASLLIHQHEGRVRARLTGDGAIRPVRSARRRSVPWPAADVGEVSFHDVTYLVPHPDAPTYLTFVFSTPNLPLSEELEQLFDTIVGTVEWVEVDPDQDEDDPAAP